MIKKYGCLILLLVFCWDHFTAQNLFSNDYKIFPKDAWDGSSRQFPYDILIDQQGILWLATSSAIVRWDGQHKRIYDEQGTHGYTARGSFFREIWEVDANTLLIQSENQIQSVYLLRKDQPNTVPTPFNFPAGTKTDGLIVDVFQNPDQSIFSVLNYGDHLSVYKLIDHTFEQYFSIPFPKLIDLKKVRAAYRDGVFWIAVDGQGVWKCTNQEQQMVFDFKTIKKDPTQILNFLHADLKNRLWLSINGGERIYQWHKQKQEFIKFKIPSPNNIDIIEEDQIGNLLFISGLYPEPIKDAHLLSDTSWTDYTPLFKPEMIAFHPSKDLRHSLVAQTVDNVALVVLQKENVDVYLNKTLTPNNRFGEIIKGINEDEEGNIYFLEESNGFYKLNKSNGEITTIDLKDELGNKLDFYCGGMIHRDKKGDFWFKLCNKNRNGRLVRFDPKTETATYFNIPEMIRDIAIDEKNNFWVVTHDVDEKRGKLFFFDSVKEQFIPLNLENKEGITYFPSPRFCWYQNDSTIWVGSIKGLVRINPLTKKFEIFNRENSELKNDRIISIYQDEDGILILGTYGGGIQVFDPINLTNQAFTKEDGLCDNFVCGIIPIDKNHYWLSTFDGIAYWDRSLGVFTNFDESHGFSVMEFNRYAYYQSDNGDIFVGNVNGANRFRTDYLINSFGSPNLGLASITEYYGKEDSLSVQELGLAGTNTFTLSPDLTYLKLDFYINDLSGGINSKIFTKLEGYDSDWILAENQSVRYSLLPPGDYQLAVKGFSAQGIPIAEQLNFKLIAKKRFLESWPFRILLTLLIMGLVSMFVRYRTQLARKEEKQNLDIQRKVTNLELQALQAQLNPHFIFNALGAIQYYIQVNDIHSADLYLTRFAQLMRKYLDGSKEKMISLKDEIELLKIYTELERLRFEEIFNVNFHYDKKMMLEEITFPSMMIQPFVENAINHGLSPRKDKMGKLDIRFTKKGQQLICEIKDNGIGRKNAVQNRRKGHKSRGMNILEEKIQIMKMADLVDITIDIADLNPEKQQYPGTIVTLRIRELADNV